MKKSIQSNEEHNVIKLYQSGLSCQKISKLYKCSQATIANYLVKNNIARRSNLINSRRLNINKDFFKDIDQEKKAYLLGFIFADGSISKSKYYLALALAEKDKEIIDLLQESIYPDKQPTLSYRTIKNKKGLSKRYVKLSISSKEICTDLINLGCFPNKTLKVRFPKIRKNLYRHFIRGYFDGDGTITFARNRPFVNIIGNIEFLKPIQNILKQEIAIKKKKIFRSSKKNKLCVLALSSVNDVYKMYNYMYENANFFLKRKYERFLSGIEIIKKSKRFGKEKSSKYKGVCFDKSRNKWMVTCHYKNLGRFLTEKAAHNARLLYEKTLQRK